MHPKAMCDSASVGAGTVVWAFAHVLDGAVIGADCKIGEHSFIEDGARLGDRVTVKNGALIWRGVTVEDEVFLGPRVTFTNDHRPRVGHQVAPEDLARTLVRRGASLGASVTVVCGVTIGAHSLIGAGTLVHRDVPAHALVVGVPGRQIGWVCMCGDSLDDNLACPCGRRYQDHPTKGLTEVTQLFDVPVPTVNDGSDSDASADSVRWAPV